MSLSEAVLGLELVLLATAGLGIAARSRKCSALESLQGDIAERQGERRAATARLAAILAADDSAPEPRPPLPVTAVCTPPQSP